jgi:hypothetical protein
MSVRIAVNGSGAFDPFESAPMKFFNGAPLAQTVCAIKDGALVKIHWRNERAIEICHRRAFGALAQKPIKFRKAGGA